MSYTTAEARSRLLADVAEATNRLGFALACVGAAYEELDQRAADVLEREIFRPLQAAYGRVKRAHTEFSARSGLPELAFDSPSPGTHSSDPRVYIERGVEAVERADHGLAELQDSLLPVEVGDQELRAALSGTRELISLVPARGRQLLRILGR
jgi:hypothetical protein